MYKKELMGGKLEWSPSHKSENFWKDNHKAFEAENCAAIKTLVALLVPESDAQTLAVACHDIGEFVKHHPEGRRLMTQFGAKLAVRRRSSSTRDASRDPTPHAPAPPSTGDVDPQALGPRGAEARPDRGPAPDGDQLGPARRRQVDAARRDGPRGRERVGAVRWC